MSSVIFHISTPLSLPTEPLVALPARNALLTANSAETERQSSKVDKINVTQLSLFWLSITFVRFSLSEGKRI